MTVDNMFRIILAAIFLTIIAVVGSYRNRAEKAGGKITPQQAREQEGLPIWLALRVSGILIWVGTLVYLIYPPVLAWAKLPLPVGLRWLGVVLLLAMIPAVIWAQSSLGGNVTKTVSTKGEHALVERGPYRYVRHPLYLLGMIAFLAISLITSTWYYIAIELIMFWALRARTKQEEEMLIARFGDDYREYMTRTGRFLPKFV